jgi:hypothetical protein
MYGDHAQSSQLNYEHKRILGVQQFAIQLAHATILLVAKVNT